MSTGRSALLFLVLVSLALWGARRWIDVVEVRGQSMAPTLQPGDRLIVVRAPGRVADVVLAFDPRDPARELIKRVTAIDDWGVTLRGDNPSASTDARMFGELPPSSVQWRAVARYWPPARIGPIVGNWESQGNDRAQAWPSVERTAG